MSKKAIWPLGERSSQRSQDNVESGSSTSGSFEYRLVSSESMEDVFRVEHRPSLEERPTPLNTDRISREPKAGGLDMSPVKSPASFVFIGKDLRHSAAHSSMYQISSGRRQLLENARKLDKDVNVLGGSDYLQMQVKFIRRHPDEAYLVHMYEIDAECNLSLHLRSALRLKLPNGKPWGEAAAELLRRHFPALDNFAVQIFENKGGKGQPFKLPGQSSLRIIKEADDFADDSLESEPSAASRASRRRRRPSDKETRARKIFSSAARGEVTYGNDRDDDEEEEEESKDNGSDAEGEDDDADDETIQIAIYPPSGKSNEILIELGREAVKALGVDGFINCTFRCPRLERERHFAWQWAKDGLVGSPLQHSIGFQMSSIAVALMQSNDGSSSLKAPARATSLPSRAVPPSSTFIFDLDAAATNGVIPVDTLRSMLLHRWFFSPHDVDKHILRDLPPDLNGIGPSWIERINGRLRKHILEGDTEDVDEDTREAILILFPYACRISLETLGGGFSGAKVYRCVNTNWDGSQEIPSVVKVDDADSLEDEFKRMVEITPLLGENAPRILARATHKDLSALRIELCGATWCLPGAGEYNTHITTFRKLYTSELARLVKVPAAPPTVPNSPVAAVMRQRRRDKVASTTELPYKRYGACDVADSSACCDDGPAGNPIAPAPHRLAPRSVSETLVRVTGSDHLVENPAVAGRRLLMRQRSRGAAMQDAQMQTIVLKRSSTMSSGSEMARSVEDQSVVFGEIEAVIGEVFGTILRTGAIDMAVVEKKSLFAEDAYPLAKTVRRHILDCDDDPVSELFFGAEARALVNKWTGLERMDVREYFSHFLNVLQNYELDASAAKQRLMGHVHGDLNGANILIDGESIVWLIDFAFSGMRPVLMDLVKLENTLLFEYTPLRTASNEHGVSMDDFAKIVEALVYSNLSELPPLLHLELDTRAGGHLAVDQLWSVLRRMRQHAAAYCEKDPRPEYLHAGRLYYALKSLAFRDLSREQKHFALASALGHASRLAHLLAPGMLGPQRPVHEYTSADKSVIEAQVTAHFKSLQREQVKHLTMVGAKDAIFVDPVSRSRLSVLNQCVNLAIAEHTMGGHEEAVSNTAKYSVMDVASKIDAFMDAFSDMADYSPIPGMVCPGDVEALCDRDELRQAYAQLALRTPLSVAMHAALEPFAALTTSMQYVPARDLSRRLIFTLIHLESEAIATIEENHAQRHDDEEEMDVEEKAPTQSTPAGALLLDTKTAATLRGIDGKLYLSPVWLRRAALVIFNEIDALHYGQFFARLADLLPAHVRVADARRLVLLGPPASGKSVFMRQVLVHGAISQSHKSSLCLVPLRIRLIDVGRHVEEHQLTEEDDLIMIYLTHLYGAASTKLAYFRHVLFAGRVLLLLDGFDEAGPARGVITRFLSRFLARHEDIRVIVTSRETGFGDFQDAFHAAKFKGLKIQTLTQELAQDIVMRRVTDRVSAELVDNLRMQQLLRQIQATEYQALAQNPLMLSLLIHVLRSSNEASASSTRRLSGQLNPAELKKPLPSREGAAMLRSQLFALAVDQMLHQGDPKYKRHRSREDKAIGRDLSLLQDPLARSILRNVALLVHSQHDIEVGLDHFGAVVVALATQSHGVDERERARIAKRLVTVNNGLQRSVQRDLVPLFQQRPVQGHNSARSREGKAFGRTLIFAHLSLQEHLAAECIAERLALCHSTADHDGFLNVCSAYFGGHRLEDDWWHDVFLSTCELLGLSSENALDRLLYALFVKDASSSHVQATLEALKLVWTATAKHGNVPVLEGLLTLRKQINASYVDLSLGAQPFDLVFIADQRSNVCLHHAAESNRLAYVNKLFDTLERGAFEALTLAKNTQSWKPGNVALVTNNLEIQRKLDRTNGDQDLADEDAETAPAMIRALKEGDIDAALKLLAQDPAGVLAARGSSGMSAAMWACALELPQVLIALIEADSARSFMTAVSQRGNTCLAFAVENNASACVDILLARGMSPTWRCPQGDTLLLVATTYGFNEVAAQLIAAGAMSGEAIVVSALQGRDSFVQKLLELCGDDAPRLVNEIVKIGVNPLASASVAGHQSTIALLLAMGADVNHPINVQMGTYALHLAVRKGHFECVDLLVTNGADVNLASPAGSAAGEGMTAMNLAMEHEAFEGCEHGPLVDYLKSHGAKTWEEMTPEERIENTRRWRDFFGEPDQVE